MGQQFELRLSDQNKVIQRGRLNDLQNRAGLPLVISTASLPAKNPQAVQAVRAQPALLTPDMAAGDAFRLTLLQCKWHIVSNVAPVIDARSIEGLHQMRVGIRRLRVALTSFGGDFRTPALEGLRERARKLGERLGPARDLDVFVGELLEPAARANGAIEAFDLLRSRAREARQRAWDFAVAHVAGPGFESFIQALSDAIDRRIWFQSAGRAHAAHGRMAFEMPAIEIGDLMLTHRMEVARKRARHMKRLSEAKRHRLRIALKKLRYTAEFFAPLYEAESVRGFLRSMTNMQDILGALNDVAVARETLTKLTEFREGMEPSEHAGLSFAGGVVYGWHLDHASHMWRKGRKRWRQFAHSDSFWRQTGS